tara:strand:+ start:322 stop:507 length:186 start_codon:yes stop_codon:yes gene_type:complete
MKAKDINIYSIFSRTYKKKIFSFMDFGEIGRLKKGKTIRQVSNVYQFPIHKYFNQPKKQLK